MIWAGWWPRVASVDGFRFGRSRATLVRTVPGSGCEAGQDVGEEVVAGRQAQHEHPGGADEASEQADQPVLQGFDHRFVAYNTEPSTRGRISTGLSGPPTTLSAVPHDPRLPVELFRFATTERAELNTAVLCAFGAANDLSLIHI